MIPSISFWKYWPLSQQRLGGLVALLSICSMAFAVAAWLQYPEPAFSWSTWQEIKSIPIQIHTTQVGNLPIHSTIDNQILFERWVPNPIEFETTPLTVYLVFFGIGLAAILAFSSSLSGIPFFGAAGLLMFLLTSFKLELLQLGGSESMYPSIGLIILLGSALLYFRYMAQTVSLASRFITFGLLLAVCFLAFEFLSPLPAPHVMLAAGTIPAAIVLSFVLFIIVGHEVIFGFLLLTGMGGKRSKPAREFFIISILYLLTLWLTYLKRVGSLDWGVEVSPVPLLAIAGLLSIRSIRDRVAILFPSLSEAAALTGAGGLSIIAFAMLSVMYASSYDLAIMTLTDLMLYTQIGFSTMFILYIISNFITPLFQGLPVYRVVYKPLAMPYASYVIGGTVFLLAFIFYNRWTSFYYQIRSTGYAAIADAYIRQPDQLLANAYYRKANEEAVFNQHAALSLAALESERGSLQKQEEYLHDANIYKPTPFTIASEAGFYWANQRRLEEMIVWRDGHNALPSNGVVNNNLGLIFAQLHLTDSALKYFALAQQDDQTRTSAEMNIFALRTEEGEPGLPDGNMTDLPNVRVNVLALKNRLSLTDTLSLPELPKDSILNVYFSTMAGNLIVNQTYNPQADTTWVSQLVSLAELPDNSQTAAYVLIPAAHFWKTRGQLQRATYLLQRVIAGGRDQGRHNTMMAKWALEHGCPFAAASFLDYARNQRDREANMLTALAAAEQGLFTTAVQAWDSLRGNNQKEDVRQTAELMVRVLTCPENAFRSLSANEKYWFIRYRSALRDTTRFSAMVFEIPDQELQMTALYDRSSKHFEHGQTQEAIRYFLQLSGKSTTNQTLFQNIQWLERRILAAQGQWDDLRNKIPEGFSPNRQTEATYLRAMLAWHDGDTTTAANHFSRIAAQNPYFSDGVVMASRFFRQHGTDSRRAYKILSEALQVNSYSIMILKEYIPVALQAGYPEYATSAWTSLSQLISPEEARLYKAQIDLDPTLFQ